jgi:ABC transporter with metal-binding/Fe-S-binding domain ATP-binding protein
MPIKHGEEMRAALFSGGKDSTLAVHKMHERGMPVDLLISMVSENEFSYMFHRPNIRYTQMQAESMGIEHRYFNTKGEKEKELEDLESALKECGVTELVTGAIASRYQADRINSICGKLGILHHAPLWGIDPLEELKELSENFNVIVTQVAAEGFDDQILGHRLDEFMIDRLVALHNTHKTNLLFEGGEAESFVLDGPLFRKRVVIRKSHIEWKGSVGQLVMEEAELQEK